MKIDCGLDTKSLNKAIREVEKYKKQLPNKVSELCNKLADIAVETAKAQFGSAATVTALPDDKGITILAEGEAVCFLEFGTGVYATGENLNSYEEVSFKVEPGSWSETEGAHKWSEWQEAGNPPETWPYNRVARPGMFLAYQAILNALEAEVKKVFT